MINVKLQNHTNELVKKEWPFTWETYERDTRKSRTFTPNRPPEATLSLPVDW